MITKDFRQLRKEELQTGNVVWLQGNSFLDTSPIGPEANSEKQLVCGPFLIERVLFGGGHIQEHRVDLVDPETGDRRSMMRSWLLVPKEQ